MKCKTCGGKGGWNWWENGHYKVRDCPSCGGTGEVEEPKDEPKED